MPPTPCEQQRDGGGDETAPQQTRRQQAAGFGLVAVEPQVAARSAGATGTVARTVATNMVAGAPDRASTSSMPAAPSTTIIVTTTVKAIVSLRLPRLAWHGVEPNGWKGWVPGTSRGPLAGRLGGRRTGVGCPP